MYYNRNLIGEDKSAVTPKDASGIFDLRSQEKHQRAQSWPGSVESYMTYTINYTGTPFELRQNGSNNISIDWGDGSSETTNLSSVTHTYSTNGIYKIKIDLISFSDYFKPDFLNTTSASRSQLVKVKFGRYLYFNIDSSFRNCNNLEEIIAPYTSTSSISSFRRAFMGCSSLKAFPLVEVKQLGNFENAFDGCSLLTTFPKLDTRRVNRFNAAWKNCSSLKDFPPNMFDITRDFSNTNHFSNAFLNCDLTAQSIENILVSLDTNGSTGVTLTIDGGNNAAKSTWSTAANTAYNNLITKGWTITFNS